MATFERGYREIGRLPELPGIDDDRADVKTLVRRALEQSYTAHWLLIVDNADDQDLLVGDAGVMNYLPSSPRGSILFTTRTREVPIKMGVPAPNIILVTSMDRKESIGLLNQRLESDEGQSYTDGPGEKDALADLLADHPLAIGQARGYIATEKLSISDYLLLYHSRDGSLMRLLEKGFENENFEQDDLRRPVAIATTWLISFERIAREAPLAAEYLKFMCFLAEKNIPASLLPLPEGGIEVERAEAISKLRKYAFVSEEKPGSVQHLSIHPLVRAIMRNWVDSQGELMPCITNVLQRLDDVLPMPSLDRERRELWMEYLPHAERALEYCTECSEVKTATNFLSKTARCYFHLSKYERAEQLLRNCVQLFQEMLPEDPEILVVMVNLGTVMLERGKYDEADMVHRQRFELQDKMHWSPGFLNYGELTIYIRHIRILHGQGKHREAKQWLRKVLELAERIYMPEDYETVGGLHELASILGLGYYEEVEQIYRMTSKAFEELQGLTHPDTLNAKANLAIAMSARDGKLAEAEEMLRHAMNLLEEEVGRNHPLWFARTRDLAEMLVRRADTRQKYEEAKQVFQEGLERAEEVLGREDPVTVDMRTNFEEMKKWGPVALFANRFVPRVYSDVVDAGAHLVDRAVNLWGGVRE